MRKLLVITLIAGLFATMLPSEALAGGRGSGSDVLAGVMLGAAAVAVTGAILGAFATPEPPPPVVYSPPPVVYGPPPVVYAPPPVVYTPPAVVYTPAPPVVYAPPVIVHPAPVVVHRPAPGWGRRYEDPRGHGAWGRGR